MPEEIYTTLDDEGTPIYSFTKSTIEDYGLAVTTLKTREFMHDEAETLALGHNEQSKIGKRQLVELFCELYKC